MDGLIRLTVTTRELGDVLVLRPTPKHGDSWGDLAPLRDTPWESYIQSIPGEIFSHALHGYTLPFIQMLGPEPRALEKKMPRALGICSDFEGCVIANPKHCHPCSDLPDCYEAPLDGPAGRIASQVALAWKEGRYVLVIEEGEFSL